MNPAFAARRFFNARGDFEAEVAMYTHPVLRETLPSLLYAYSNADGSLRSRSGFVFPPFLVLERGVTLKAWRNAGARSFFEAAAMVESVAALLATLHGAGYVHRDLKPDNVLHLLHSGAWRLLDLGIVARAGGPLPPLFCLRPCRHFLASRQSPPVATARPVCSQLCTGGGLCWVCLGVYA
jgi:hypothetical protein